MKKISKTMCHDCGHEEIDIDDVVCNKCGETCKIVVSMSTDRTFFNYGGLRAKIVGGYCSKWDAQEVEFDLCESCITKLIRTFKIKPEVTDVPI